MADKKAPPKTGDELLERLVGTISFKRWKPDPEMVLKSSGALDFMPKNEKVPRIGNDHKKDV